jgi:hypothetical protein
MLVLYTGSADITYQSHQDEALDKQLSVITMPSTNKWFPGCDYIAQL